MYRVASLFLLCFFTLVASFKPSQSPKSSWRGFFSDDDNSADPYCISGPLVGANVSFLELYIQGETKEIAWAESICQQFIGPRNETSYVVEIMPKRNYVISMHLMGCIAPYPISNLIGGWIDWNIDSIFGDDERIFFNQSFDEDGYYSGSFQIPDVGLYEPTRVRFEIQSQDRGGNFATMDPCALFDYGETLDFTANIIPPLPDDPVVRVEEYTDLACTQEALNGQRIYRLAECIEEAPALSLRVACNTDHTWTMRFFDSDVPNCDGEMRMIVTAAQNRCIPIGTSSFQAFCPDVALVGSDDQELNWKILLSITVPGAAFIFGGVYYCYRKQTRRLDNWGLYESSNMSGPGYHRLPGRTPSGVTPTPPNAS